eukprot:Gb_37915 [translate_table: standard]
MRHARLIYSLDLRAGVKARGGRPGGTTQGERGTCMKSRKARESSHGEQRAVAHAQREGECGTRELVRKRRAGKKDEGKWWTKETVAMVTGANKSIGLEVVRHLAKEGIIVVLTTRNEESGLAATNSVVAQGYSNVHFHQLDVQSDSSVSNLAHWLDHKFNGIHLLIFNSTLQTS